MGWFDEQIRQRIKNDNDAFSDALKKWRALLWADLL